MFLKTMAARRQRQKAANGNGRHVSAFVAAVFARSGFLGLCLGLGLLLTAPCAKAQEVLSWNTNLNRVTADIRNGDFARVLGKIAGSTSWDVFVEPGATNKISTKFTNLAPGAALGRILGNLNYAFVPGSTNARPRLLVFATKAGNATQAVKAIRPDKPKAKVIPNEVVVRLRPGANIEELAAKLGAKVKGGIKGLNTYRLEFANAEAADSARKILETDESVQGIGSNYSILKPLEPDVSLDGPGLPSRPNLTMNAPSRDGRVIVGLLDTAVQSLGPELDAFLMKQMSVAGPSRTDSSEPSHGTSMAETLLKSLEYSSGGSTSVQILPVDVYGPNPSTSTFDLANGIVQAVNSGARIINMSLGSDADSPVLRDVIREASAKGVLFFAAAGNTPVTQAFYPAAYPEVMAVTAVEHGQIAPYANRGDFVSLAAPGTSVVYFNDIPYYVTGTSASSAFAAGAAAGFMEKAQANAQGTREHVTSLFGVRGSRDTIPLTRGR